jgi:hypothetical protein
LKAKRKRRSDQRDVGGAIDSLLRGLFLHGVFTTLQAAERFGGNDTELAGGNGELAGANGQAR